MKFFTLHKKTILLTLFIAVIALSPLSAGVVGAQTQNTLIANAAVSAVGWANSGGFGAIFANILMIPITLSAWVLGISGVLLNWVLEMTVVNMKGNLSSITGINMAWSVIRDLSNMVFIFSLLYVSIGTILNVGGADWKKTIKSIVIAAVLINFSLLIANVIIDASNIVTLGIYRQIIPNDGQSLGLSNKIMSNLGVVTLYQPDKENLLAQTMGNDLVKIGIVSIGSSVFMLITAFNFIAVSFMFIIRYVTIIFLLVFSPVAVMASVLPNVKKQSGKWWEQLSGQALFGPVYMILMWVVLTIISSPGLTCVPAPGEGFSAIFTETVGKGSGAVNAISNVAGQCTSMGLLFNFTIVMALLIGTLSIAKSFSNQKGGEAATLVGGALGFGGGTLGGFAARNTIGRGANAFLKSKTGTALQAKADQSFTARRILGASKSAANSSFDVRNSKNISKLASAGQVDLGKGQGAGGFVAQKKTLDEFFTRPGSDAAKKRAEEVRKAKTSQIISAGTASGAAIGTPPVDALHQQITRMTPKEVEKLGFGKLKNPLIAQHISSQQLEAAMKSDDYTDDQKDELKQVRFGDIFDAFDGVIPMTSQIEDKIKGLTDGELEMVAPRILANPDYTRKLLGILKRGQVDDLSKSKTLTTSQKKKISDARTEINKDKLLGNATSTPPVTAAPNLILKMDAKDIAQLDVTTLTHPSLLPLYNPKLLKRLGGEIKEDAKTAAIKSAIMTLPPATAATPTSAAIPTDAQKWLNSPEGQSLF